MGRSQRKRVRLHKKPFDEPDGGGVRSTSAQVRLLGCLIVVVAGIVLAAHWPALSARTLSFDDNQYLTENPLVRNPSWSSAGRFLSEVLEPSTVRGYYQPLAMISLMLDSALGGRVDGLRPFHRTSLGLHVANTALVIVFLYLLFRQPWAAAIVGLLYGVHPLTVEPIPWVGERKTLLTAFFAMWSLILYVRYARTTGRGPYVVSIVMYALALMSKPTSTPLPVLMLLLDYWPGRRLGRRAVLEKIPFFVIGGVFAVITYVSQAGTAGVTTPSDYPVAVIPLTLCHNIVFYLQKIVWPTNLSSHYPYPEPFNLSQPTVLAGLVGTCVLIPALLLSSRRTPAPLVGWLFFFVAIFPTMGVISFTHVIASDKYAYLPAVGLLLPLAWLTGRAWATLARRSSRVPPQLGIVGIALILAGMAFVSTRRQLVHWQDTEGHFRYMLRLAPDARVLHFGVANALREKARALMREPKGRTQELDALVPEAIEHYRRALQPKLDSPFGHNAWLTCAASNDLGNLLVGQGKIDEAITHWRRALRLDPNNVNAHNNMGIGLARKGRTDEAIRHYNEALRIRPDLPETHNNLGLELARKGKIDQAIEHFAKAVRLKPDLSIARRNLKAMLAAQGKTEQDIQAVLRSLTAR